MKKYKWAVSFVMKGGAHVDGFYYSDNRSSDDVFNEILSEMNTPANCAKWLIIQASGGMRMSALVKMPEVVAIYLSADTKPSDSGSDKTEG